MPSFVLPFPRRTLIRGLVALIIVALALPVLLLLGGAATAFAETLGAAGGSIIARDPDGSGTSSDLYLVDTKGEERLLTDGTAKYRQAVFSPDGTKIAYVKQPAGGGPGDIYVMDADGTDPVRMTTNADDDADPDWSPDGTKLAFSSDRSGQYQIYSVAIATPNTQNQLTPAGSMGASTESLDPSWSPDGNWIAVTHRNVNDAAQIWRVNPAGTAGEPITNTSGDHRDPAYSPDGSLLAFTSNRNVAEADRATDFNYEVFVRSTDMTVADSTATAITTGPNYEGFAQWLPRASTAEALRLVYSRTLAQDDNELRIVNADGTNDAVYMSTPEDDFEASFQPLPGCTIVWDGGGGTNSWQTDVNWSGDLVPSETDAACIPDMKTPVAVTLNSGVAAVASITTSENFTLSNGSLDADTVTLRDGASALLSGGSLRGSSTLAGGRFEWQSGAGLGLQGPTDTGTTTIAPDAVLALTTDGGYYLRGGRVLDNQGTIELVEADWLERYPGESSRLLNSTGTVVKRAVDGQAYTTVTTLPIPFDNDGTLLVESGTLELSSPDVAGEAVTDDVHSGTFDVRDGATLNFAAGQADLAAADSQLTGVGTYKLTGGILNVGANGLTLPAKTGGNSFVMTGGTLRGSGALAGGEFIWHSAARLGDYAPSDTGTWTIAEGATLSLPTDGGYYLRGDRVLDNKGTIELVTVDWLDRYPGESSRLVNTTGTVVKRAVDGQAYTTVTTLPIPFDNDATLRVESGELQLQTPQVLTGGGDTRDVHSGTFAVAAGGTLDFASGYTKLGAANSQLTGEGTYELTGGTLDVGGNGVTLPAKTGGNSFVMTGGTLRGSGALAGGEFIWHSAARLGDYDPSDTGTWTIAEGATLSLPTDGGYYLRGGRVLDNQGTIELVEADWLDNYPGEDGQLNNSTGTIVKRAVDGQAYTTSTTLEIPLTNTGTVDVRSGSLGLPTIAGTTLTSGGYLVHDAATLRFSGTPAIATNEADVEIRGTARIVDAGDQHLLRNLAANAGSITLRNGAALDTSETLANTGDVLVYGDSVLTTAAYTQSAGTTDLHDPASKLEAPGGVTLTGGTLLGNGTITGAVVNSGATIAPGNSPGSFTIDGTFAQDSAGALEMEITGSQAGEFDELNVTGTAQIGGVLDVVTSGGYTPSWDSAFSVIAAPTLDVSATISGLALGDGLEYTIEQVDGQWKLLTTDTSAPTNPSAITSSDPTASRWSSDSTVALTLSDAGADDNSGVGSYELTWAKSDADPIVQNVAAGDPLVSVPLPTGQYSVDLRTIDREGNRATSVISYGPVYVDVTAPAAVTFSSDLPATGWMRTADAVSLTTPADVGSGVSGLSAVWTETATVTAPTDANTDASATSIPAPTATGVWYLHVAPVDGAGNWGDVNTYGPLKLDVDAPAAPAFSSTAPAAWVKSHTAIWSEPAAGDDSEIAGYRPQWTSSATPPEAPTAFTSPATVQSTTAPATSGSHYLHLWAFDTAGNRSAAATYGPVHVDVAKPTGGVISSPKAGLPYSVLLKGTTPQVKVTWSAAKDSTSGVKSVALLPSSQTQTSRWVNGAAIAVSRTATTKTINGKAGTTYCFKVKVVDNAGNARVSSPACAAVPIDGAKLTHSKGWTKPAGKAYYLGSVSKTSKIGATLVKKNVRARSLGIVASKCSTCGSVVVLWNGKQVGKSISLKGRGNRVPIHVGTVARAGKTSTGTLTIKATTRKAVMVDAVAVSTK